jgi:hypothetical protein
MNEPITKEKPKRRWVTILAGGYLIILYVALLIMALIFSRGKTVIRNDPTLTPTTVPTPHILVHQPIKNIAVVHDDFSANRREWGLFYPNGKLEIINGKLILQSNINSGFVIGTSEQFAPSGEKYYVQADFLTDIDQPSPYGLLFGLNRSLGTFYAFEVRPKFGSFRLLKYNAGKWHDLVPHSKLITNPYPEVNTFSVYFDAGNIELYVNGNLVSKILDNDFFRSTDVGIFVSNSGYRLIVDDFFIYNDK